jgi:transcriptional regulator of acetoin/glycerol metabolism
VTLRSASVLDPHSKLAGKATPPIAVNVAEASKRATDATAAASRFSRDSSRRRATRQLCPDAARRRGIRPTCSGETSTGKEHIARELHRRSGRTAPFLAVSCAGYAELMTSQLFGIDRE